MCIRDRDIAVTKQQGTNLTLELKEFNGKLSGDASAEVPVSYTHLLYNKTFIFTINYVILSPAGRPDGRGCSAERRQMRKVRASQDRVCLLYTSSDESAVYKLVYNGLTNALLYDNREADAFVPPPIPEPPAASSFQAPAPARHTLPEIWTRTEAVREEREILPAAPSAPAEEPALPETCLLYTSMAGKNRKILQRF